MKTMLTAALAVLICTLGVCLWGTAYIDEATDEISDMALMLMGYAEAEKYDEAQEIVTRMANQWQKALPVLSMLADHDDLHDVTERIVEGGVHLKYRHANDFYQSMALLDEALRHLRGNEDITLSNLL